MERISDEKLDEMIYYCGDSLLSYHNSCYEVAEALQELKERRAADKPLDIKGQLRLVRDKCPDVWKTRAYNQHCPDYFGMPSRKAHDEIGDIDKCVPCKDCDACMNKALEGDE